MPPMIKPQLWILSGLLLCPLVAQEPAPSPEVKKRLEALQVEQTTLIKEWRAKIQEAAKAAEADKGSGKPIPALPMRPDMGALRQKYIEAAGEFPGDDALHFLLPALTMSGEQKQSQAILTKILTDHIESSAIDELGGLMPHLDRFVGKEAGESARASLIKHGKHKRVLGWITFAREESAPRGNPVGSAEYDAAKSTVKAAMEAAASEELTETVQGLFTELEKFGVGMMAPDIAGIDLEGVEFKLSDYKGKILFVDFWGDW